MNAKVLILFSAFVLIAVACSEDTATNEPQTNDGPLEILPLQVGNWWSYNYFDTMMGDTIPYPSLLTDSVVHKAAYDGVDWYSFTMPDSAGRVKYFRNTDAGFVEQTGASETMIWQYPSTTGASYPDGWMNPIQTCTVASTDTLISVPAGDFHCYYYQISYQGKVNRHFFFCPGVGKVKFVQLNEFAGEEYEVLELHSYHVK